VPWLLAVQHRHAAVPAAEEHQARLRRHLHLPRPLTRLLTVRLSAHNTTHSTMVIRAVHQACSCGTTSSAPCVRSLHLEHE